ncbi:MAG: phage integrase N-terminal SAM-like domain-containing protein [Verrucomicrobiae bacterium]|nr:phage integrase N-terminal SAM-like domain-containing protein [Verrucomicrobiae bacterium]
MKWFLGFCRRGRGEVTVQSARDFVEWATQQKEREPWQIEGWKAALNWFFREASRAARPDGFVAGQPSVPEDTGPGPAEAGCDRSASTSGNSETEAWGPSTEGATSVEGLEPEQEPEAEAGTGPRWKVAFLTEVRRRHYSYRTEQTYMVWIARFARHFRTDDVERLGEAEIGAFLDSMALNERLSASSQRQALNALVFLFREVFGRELGDFSDYRRAKVRPHLPVWLTREELGRLLDRLEEPWRLMAQAMYGSGLRLMELLRLRVKGTPRSSRAPDASGTNGRGDGKTGRLGHFVPVNSPTGSVIARRVPWRRGFSSGKMWVL